MVSWENSPSFTPWQLHGSGWWYQIQRPARHCKRPWRRFTAGCAHFSWGKSMVFSGRLVLQSIVPYKTKAMSWQSWTNIEIKSIIRTKMENVYKNAIHKAGFNSNHQNNLGAEQKQQTWWCSPSNIFVFNHQDPLKAHQYHHVSCLLQFSEALR